MKSAWNIAGFTFDPDVHLLIGDGAETRLEPRTAAVLLHLVEHAGEVRSREQVLNAVWQDTFVAEAALTHCIWELRRAFGDDARAPKVIQTVPRRGYRLIAAAEKPSSGRQALMTLLRVDRPADGSTVVEGDDPDLLQVLESLGAPENGTGAPRRVLTDDGPVWLFERPFDAVRAAVALHRAADGPMRAAIHMDEVLLSAPVDEATPRVDGPAYRTVRDVLGLAQEGQTLLTRVAFDMARRVASRVSDAAQGEQPRDDEALCWAAHGLYTVTCEGEAVEDGAGKDEAGEDEPIEIFEVGHRGRDALTAPAGSASAGPVGAPGMILGWRPGPGLPVPHRPHWRLVEKLGEGSFGEVWRVEHQKTSEGRVFKFCFETEKLRALQREVTLFRLLKETLGDRDDIVHLLDWNFDEAPFFIEMEHTSAGSLADWWERQGGADAIPLPQRLELVAQTADALAAAHSVGVLHKDVKPSNILIHVDHHGIPHARLGDFGIGGVLDPARLVDAGITQLGMTRLGSTGSSGEGTRLYMSPEALEGRTASTEADVYGLGVVLYQLVVGELRRAVAEGWQRQVEDEILVQDIAACVDVSPERRPSARRLAWSLRRLETRRAELEQERRERESARRDRELAEARLEALRESQRRRRRWLIATLSALGLVVVVSILGWQAQSARQAAQESRRRAEDMVTYMLGDLRHTLGAVGRLDAMDGTVEKVLEYLDALDLETAGDVEIEHRAEALRQLGEVRFEQGQLDEATALFAAAAESAARLVARDPSRLDWRAGEADSLYWSAFVEHRRGRLGAAREGYEAHRARYEALVEIQPDHRDWRLELAYGHHNVALVAGRMGDLDEAAFHFEQSREVFEALTAEEPENAELELLVSGVHNRLGDIAHRRGDLRSALESYRADQGILRRLLDQDPLHVDIRKRLATAGSSVASLLLMMGRPAASLEEAEAVSALRRELVELDPGNPHWELYEAVARRRVGQALLDQGLAEDALAPLDAARQTLERLMESPSPTPALRRQTGILLHVLAAAHLRLGQRQESRLALDRSLAVLEAALVDRPQDSRLPTSLAHGYLLMGDWLVDSDADGDAAAAFWRRAEQSVGELEGGANNPERLALRARALLRLGDVESARPLVERLRTMEYAAADFVTRCRQAGL